MTEAAWTPPAGYEAHLAHLEAELEILPDKPDETAEATLRALWSLAEGRPASLSQLTGYEPGELDAGQRRILDESIARRLEGTPLAHITGLQDFMGLVFLTSPAALVPRRETELLVREALGRLRAMATNRPMAVDVCAGAGNVTLALAHGAPTARVYGSDLDEGAVELARANARHLDRSDVEFRAGDLLEPFDQEGFLGQVDLLTCNPPYISSSRVGEMAREISGFEPRLAFDGGAFGVSILRRLVSDAPRWLRSGGWLLTEVGLGQGPTVSRLMDRSPDFGTVESATDDAGDVRVVAARRS